MTDDVMHRIAEILNQASLDEAEQRLVLDCAREVAHTTERRNAPLTAFLLGMTVAAAPTDRQAALTAAVNRVGAVLGPAQQDPAGS